MAGELGWGVAVFLRRRPSPRGPKNETVCWFRRWVERSRKRAGRCKCPEAERGYSTSKQLIEASAGREGAVAEVGHKAQTVRDPLAEAGLCLWLESSRRLAGVSPGQGRGARGGGRPAGCGTHGG